MTSSLEKGFTLIEVLIASLILFSMMAVGTTMYKTSMGTMEKVTATTLLSRALPSIMENIKVEIFQKKASGKGRFNDFITYAWHSTPAKQSKNILSVHAGITSGLQFGNFNIVLNDVFLTATYGDGFFVKEKKYEYKELFWTK